MKRIRGSLVLLAAWAALSVGLWLVASLNFRTADRVSEPGQAPTLEAHLGSRGMDVAQERPALRFLASEINRSLFRGWAMAQLVLAVALLALTLTEPAMALWGKAAVAGASGLAAVLGAVLMPLLRRIGPPLDFVPRPVPAALGDAHGAFVRAHGAFVALDIVKVGLLVVALVAVVRVRDRSQWGDIGPGA